MLKVNHPRIQSPLSKISFGGASISGEGRGYGFGQINETASIDLLLYALDRGITVFDTAPIYGFNTSEQRIGKAFNSIREKVTIVSKAGVTWHDNMRVNMSNEPKIIQKMLEQSLRSLNTDYIDIYMVHWPDKKVDIRKSLEILENAKNKGLIKNIGLCNSNDNEVLLGSEVCEIDVLQSEYNLFNNGFKCLKTTDLSKFFTMGWGSLDKGILTGKLSVDSKFDQSDCRSWAPWWKKSNWKEKVQKVEMLKRNFSDLTPIELATGFSFSSKEIDSPIYGARNIDQLEHIVSLFDEVPAQSDIVKAKSLLE